MKSILIAALCAVSFTAQAEEVKRDTIHKYTIDKQAVEHFDGSQLEGKHISKYIIAYKENGNVVEKHHVIYTGEESEKEFTIVGDADGPMIVSKNLGPLMIVDGKEVSEEGMALIKSEDVASVNVFEPNSKIAKKYGEKGSKGVVMVTTKNAISAKVKVLEPLVIVDGKEVSHKEFGNIKPETIDHIEVLKGGSKAAIECYGEKGSNGVIIVTTKAPESNVSANGKFDVEVNKALIIVDGKEISYEEFAKLKPKSGTEYTEKFANMEILRPGSKEAEAYREKGRNGVVIVTTRAGEKK